MDVRSENENSSYVVKTVGVSRPLSVKFVKASAALDAVRQRGQREGGLELRALSSSDLEPGTYEGGFKIWECCWDLCRFLQDTLNADELTNMDILEIGCGAGLPGIVALLKGAASCCFQDFNEEVLEYVTKPNVSLNGISPICAEFVSGDWSSVRQELQGRSKGYDVILTSETIYQPDNYDKLCQLLLAVLRKSGVIYVAAKTYYFGLRGTLRDFIDFVESQRLFSVNEVFCSQSGSFVMTGTKKWCGVSCTCDGRLKICRTDCQ